MARPAAQDMVSAPEFLAPAQQTAPHCAGPPTNPLVLITVTARGCSSRILSQRLDRSGILLHPIVQGGHLDSPRGTTEGFHALVYASASSALRVYNSCSMILMW